MTRASKFRRGLAAKLAVCVIASTAAFFVLFGYLNLRMARSNSEALVKQSADRLANISADGSASIVEEDSAEGTGLSHQALTAATLTSGMAAAAMATEA